MGKTAGESKQTDAIQALIYFVFLPGGTFLSGNPGRFAAHCASKLWM
jgi:hypothetical protein